MSMPKYETLAEYAERHGKSYQRARMLTDRLAKRGLAAKVGGGRGGWIVRPDAPWVGDGCPNSTENGKKL